MLKGCHTIIVDVLVERVEHGVDRLLRATVAVCGLMMRIGTLDVFHALITFRKCIRQSEVLLGFICVDLLSVEVGVLADDLRLEELIIFFVDFVKDLVDICRAQSLS